MNWNLSVARHHATEAIIGAPVRAKDSSNAGQSDGLATTTLARSRRNVPALILSAALLYWSFQVAWFWRYCEHNINADAISYIGIARHLADGNFRASLHGYWSPLISWSLVATSFAGHDPTLAARRLMLVFFALSMALIFALTQKLWGSRYLSALAVLWFTASRGMAAFSVYFIGADLLLTAAVLLYFILLLECLEHPRHVSGWLLLGVIHGLAFLAKAVALPLLACTTLPASIWSCNGNRRQGFRNLVVAAVFPILVWAAWGMSLRTKYGVFTTGYQLRWNLIDPQVKKTHRAARELGALVATDTTYDQYMVADVMPPGSRFWNAKVFTRSLVPQVLHNERTNIPQACKELLVLLTPGGLLALLICVWRLGQKCATSRVRFHFALAALCTTAALVAAYGMLVFDGRYVIPVSAVLISLSVGFCAPVSGTSINREHDQTTAHWRLALVSLIVLGLLSVQFYWGSPFRTIRQDYQRSIYQAADLLRKDGARRVVSVGEGPYPEHGVGWEAGPYSAYFSGSKIIAAAFTPPLASTLAPIIGDIHTLSPDAVMIWGSPLDSNYSTLVQKLGRTSSQWSSTRVAIRDPYKGEVGTIFLHID